MESEMAFCLEYACCTKVVPYTKSYMGLLEMYAIGLPLFVPEMQVSLPRHNYMRHMSCTSHCLAPLPRPAATSCCRTWLPCSVAAPGCLAPLPYPAASPVLPRLPRPTAAPRCLAPPCRALAATLRYLAGSPLPYMAHSCTERQHASCHTNSSLQQPSWCPPLSPINAAELCPGCWGGSSCIAAAA